MTSSAASPLWVCPGPRTERDADTDRKSGAPLAALHPTLLPGACRLRGASGPHRPAGVRAGLLAQRPPRPRARPQPQGWDSARRDEAHNRGSSARPVGSPGWEALSCRCHLRDHTPLALCSGHDVSVGRLGLVAVRTQTRSHRDWRLPGPGSLGLPRPGSPVARKIFLVTVAGSRRSMLIIHISAPSKHCQGRSSIILGK